MKARDFFACALLATTLAGFVPAALALPTVSLTSPPAGATYGNPASVPLAATATPTSGSAITRVEFYRGGTTLIATVNAPGPYTATWNHNVNGSYSITAKAYDSTGNRTSTARSITIANNTLPTVSISSPANNAMFTSPANITINATAADTDGTVAKVEFFNGAALLGTDSSSPYSFAWNGVAAGSYSLTAKATDNSGGVKTSTARAITVIAPPPPPTVNITSPANNATFTPPASIAIAASATPGSGASISKVEFFNGASLLGADTSAPYTFNWTSVPAGSYSLTARATDNFSTATTSAPVAVTVAVPLPPPTVALTSPAPGMAYAAPATVALAATAAASAPATISRVDFYNGTTLLGTANSTPYTFNWTGVPSGGYSITAKATDSTGASTTSAPSYAIVDGADSCTNAPPLTANEAETKFASLGTLPMTFEANLGQAHARVRYQVRGPGYQLFLTPKESVLALQGPVQAKPQSGSRLPRASTPGEGVALRMRFLGANPDPVVTGVDPVAHRSHYLAGSNAAAWRTNVPHFARVRYENLYPGIDEIFYGTQGKLEYDLVVAPGANPRAIRFALEGAKRVSIDRDGDLVLETGLGNLVQKKPVAYQEIDGRRHAVPARYRLVAANQVAFALGKYDARHPLVIDPVLVYSTYVGGTNNGSGANAIALSRCGEAFIAGWSYATDFPTTPGAIRRTAIADQQMGFVAKLDQAGTALLYSTYLTGTTLDLGDGFPQPQYSEATSIAVDATGHAYVAGVTNATDFPATPGSWNAAPLYPGSPAGFVSRLNTDGTGFLYSTYAPTGLDGIAVDAAGSAYIVGSTGLWKIDPAGATQAYAFTVGGSGYPASSAFDMAQSVAVDAAGNAYVAGITYSNDLPVTAGAFQTVRPNPAETSRATGFVSKVNAAGTVLAYGTYLGTAGLTYPAGIAIDAAGNAFVTGTVTDKTGIPNFTGTVTSFNNNSSHAGNLHAFAAKLNAAGAGLAYFSRIGGSTCDVQFCNAASTHGYAIAVDAAGSAWVTGTTGSNQVPLVKPLNSTITAGPPAYGTDLFAAKLSPSGTSLAFSTLLGGATDAVGPPSGPSSPMATGIALDAVGSAYVTGMTNKTDFPTTAGAFQTTLGAGAGLSAFVAKINETKDTTTALAVAPSPGAVGSPTTLTATVTGNTPTGTVSFRDGAATIGTAPVAGTTAELVTSSLAGGTHSLSAVYAGDAHNNPSASAAVLLNVTDPLTPPTVTMTGIADGASFATNAGSTYTGGSVTVVANAAAGNLLTRVTIYLDGNYTFWNVAAASHTQVWNLPALSPGVYTIAANAQDNQGHTTATARVRFVVNASPATPPTAVAITAPANGTGFVSPEPIAITASATAAAPKTIASLTYYAGGSVIGTANASPYTFAWTNAPAGTHSLMALATDSAGGRTLSAPVTVTVAPPQPPTVAMTAPAAGASFTAPATIALAADATAAPGATITRVEFLEGATVIGTVTAAPYAFNWTNVAAGTYAITARATDSRTSTATSAPLAVTVAPYVPPPPVLSISASPGIDGSTVNEATVLVSGTITAPPNSGVTVNGMLAAVGSGGQFSVNDVPLAAGANTLTLTVTTQDGETASQAIAVTSSGAGAPYAVSVNPPEGVAPLDVAFSVSGSSTLPVATIEFDLDGDGSVDYTASSLAAANITATYSTPGVARPRITFKDSAGMVLYTTTRQVPIANAVDKYNLVKGAYTDMVNRLKAGTTSTALNLFFGHSRAIFEDLFNKLGADLPSMAGQLGSILSINISQSTGELILSRDVAGIKQVFPVYLMRGEDGIWRIESM